MQNNLLLKSLMGHYQLRSDYVAQLMSEQLNETLKKRKVNAFCVSPDNKSFQHCHDHYLLSLLKSLALHDLLDESDKAIYMENQHHEADLKAAFLVKYLDYS